MLRTDSTNPSRTCAIKSTRLLEHDLLYWIDLAQLLTGLAGKGRMVLQAERQQLRRSFRYLADTRKLVKAGTVVHSNIVHTVSITTPPAPNPASAANELGWMVIVCRFAAA